MVFFFTSVPQGPSQVALVVTNPPASAGDLRDTGSIPGSEDPLEKKMATYSSILAWRIPWTEEPGRLPSIGSLRVEHDWSDFICTYHKNINNMYVDYIQLNIDIMSVFRQEERRGRILTFMNVNRVGHYIWSIICLISGFPGGSDGEESTCNIGNLGLIPASGRSSGEGNGYPLQYSCLENPMDRGAWRATVPGVTKRQTWLRD